MIILNEDRFQTFLNGLYGEAWPIEKVHVLNAEIDSRAELKILALVGARCFIHYE